MIYKPYNLPEPGDIKDGGQFKQAYRFFLEKRLSLPSEVSMKYYEDLTKTAARLNLPSVWRVHPMPEYQYPVTVNQVQEISNIVSAHTQAFLYETMGYDLSKDKLKSLIKSGILGKKVVRTDFPTDMFQFGRVMNAIENGVDVHDAKRIASRTPITPIERATIEHVRNGSCTEVVGLGNDFSGKIKDIIIEKNQGFLREMIATGIEKKHTYAEIASEIGRQTGDYGRDLFRIVYTEGHSYSQLAVANELKKNFGYNPIDSKPMPVKVCKVPERDACKYCYQLYVNPDGSLKVFDLDTMLESAPLMNTPYTHNGEQIRRKASRIGDKVHGWVATIGATHPYCRCMLKMWFPHLYDRKYIQQKIDEGRLKQEYLAQVNSWAKQYGEYWG